jgi:hypothetical protein
MGAGPLKRAIGFQSLILLVWESERMYPKVVDRLHGRCVNHTCLSLTLSHREWQLAGLGLRFAVPSTALDEMGCSAPPFASVWTHKSLL